MIRTQKARQSPLQTLSTAEFRWLHEEGWEAAELKQICERLKPAAFSLSKPKLVFRRRKDSRSLWPGGRWLLSLSDQKESPFIYAEATIEERRFQSLNLFIGVIDESLVSKDFLGAGRAVSYLVSAVLIAFEADRLDVSIDSNVLRAHLESLSWGETKEVWGTKIWDCTGECDDLASTCRIAIDPSHWWEQPHGKADREALHYLVQRVAPKPDLKASRKRRGGFFRLR